MNPSQMCEKLTNSEDFHSTDGSGVCSNTTLIAGESNAEWDVRRNFLPLLLRFREKHVKALPRVDLPAISLFLNEQAILLRDNEVSS